ncbi:hypothetical protein [Lactiplantibacillus plantarum]|uniref:hypothetical protein n=1 Tax=Lactiplantibacillus plantarum TaxID=1590 RepID=UPI003F52BB9F
MAKTLSFTDTSPQTVKIGDTTTSFTLVCGNDNVATDLTNATSITVKLGNASGYLKSATVDPAKLTDPTTGQVTVTFNADLMTSLTAGSYAIEVWVVDSTGTSIYPSESTLQFQVNSSLE